MPCGVDGFLAREWLLADGNDATFGNTNIGNVIKHRFGIDDAPVINDQIIVLGKGRRNGLIQLVFLLLN